MSNESAAVIVTGAAGNLGRATARLLARRGLQLVAVDRDAAVLRTVLEALDAPERHHAIAEADLTEPAACERVVAQTVERFGRIDGVVQTVGGFESAPLADAGIEAWQRMFRLNVAPTVNLFRAVIPAMRPHRRGSLVAIGAGAALQAAAGLAAYAAAKSAVLRLTESYAAELKADGIRVNAVLPGTIDTPQNRAAMPGADHTAWVRPDELAEVIAFLLDEASSGITGALIPVNGRT